MSTATPGARNAATRTHRRTSLVARIALTIAVGIVGAVLPATAASAVAVADDAYAVVAGHLLYVPAPGVLANDLDIPPGYIAAKGPGGPSGFTLGYDGGIEYTPSLGVSSVVTVSYCISPAILPPTCETPYATISITVTGPTLNADSFTVTAGETLAVEPPGVLANDTGLPPSPFLIPEQTNAAPNPILTPQGGLLWSPGYDRVGVHTFTYCLSIDPGASPPSCSAARGTITITVLGPSIADDHYRFPSGSRVVVPASDGVLANDGAVPAGTIAAWQTAPPAGVTLYENGAVYWNGASSTGTFTFAYCIVAEPTSPNRRCVTPDATVTIDIVEPVAAADAFTVEPGGTLEVPAPGVLGNDVDVPFGTIPEAENAPTGFDLGRDGGLRWTAPMIPGVHEIDYCMVSQDDPFSLCFSNTATITVVVAVAPDPPAPGQDGGPDAASADVLPPTGGAPGALLGLLGLVAVGVGAALLGRIRWRTR